MECAQHTKRRRNANEPSPSVAFQRSVIAHRCVLPLVLTIALTACGTAARRDAPLPPTMEKDSSGRYYLDDGPGPNPPQNLESIPDAVVRLEPLHRAASRPYTVMGRHFVPMTTLARYKARGTATWYGRRYHGKPTSSGETYDMYAMTAAHTTLPIPSYARVTNLANGKSIVVRVNDRGPFVGDRLIDLSYTAAYKLGLVADGRGMVEVESILPGDPSPATVAAASAAANPSPAAVATASAAPGPTAEVATARAAPGERAPVAVRLAETADAPVAAPPPPPAAAPSPSAVAESGASSQPASGVYVQFGAFRSRENAESLLSRLRQQMEWLAVRLHVLPREGLYRVHAGPYASQVEARQIANRIGDALGARPVLLKW